MPDDLSTPLIDNRKSLVGAQSLIETVFPVSRLSLESFVERDAKQNQTLTATGSYWKGRKPLILVRACVLASLLPPSGTDAASRVRDMDMFLRLMAMDDAGLRRRHRQAMGASDASPLLTPDEREIYLEPGANKPTWRKAVSPAYARAHLPAAITETFIKLVGDKPVWATLPVAVVPLADPEEPVDNEDGVEPRRWSPVTAARQALRRQGDLIAFERMTYRRKLDFCVRPEELETSIDPEAWDEINDHFRTSARSMQEFVEQIGIMRFGRRPRVSDRFAGGGSIPFEAARLGCDVEATDLNPIAGMLTWAALNVVGGTDEFRVRLSAAQRRAAEAVDARLTEMKFEHNDVGDRAKAFLYCLETRCPTTGWMVPMSPTWIVHKWKNVVLDLVENPDEKRFDLRCIVGATTIQMAAAAKGTCQGDDLVYTIEGVPYRRSLKSVRGDVRIGRETTNALRPWTLDDIRPGPDDVYQERLICIRWIGHKHGEDLYTSPEADDLVVRI